MRDDFNRLPPMPEIVDKIDAAERFMLLDQISVTARDVPVSPATVAKTLAFMEKTGGDIRERALWKLLLEAAGDTAIDWDIPLRMGNARYDQWVNVMRKPAGVKRREMARVIDKNAAAMLKTATDKAVSEQSLPDDARDVRSRRLGVAFMAAFSTELTTLLCIDDRATMRLELTKVAFALAAYRTDHGSYPAKLADLTPTYVSVVPKDIFNDAELHYRPENDGYLLYSVGINGKDDGGKSYGDRKKNEDWDDLAVRMSPAARP